MSRRVGYSRGCLSIIAPVLRIVILCYVGVQKKIPSLCLFSFLLLVVFFSKSPFGPLPPPHMVSLPRHGGVFFLHISGFSLLGQKVMNGNLFFSFSFSCLEPGNHTYLLPTLISYSSHLRRKDKICKSYYDSWYGDFFSLFISTYIYIYIYNTKRRYSFAFDVSYSHHICQCNLIFILV